jgi:hypothetical protein
MMSLRAFVTLILCGLLLIPSSTRAGWQTNGNPICDETGSQIDPQLVPDGEGGVLIVWSDTRFGSQDIFAQRVDAYGNELWDPNGVPVCTAAATQSGPEVVLSGLGGAIVAWTDQRNSATTGNDIYIQKLDPNGAPQWTINGLQVTNAAFDQSGPGGMVPDGEGGAILAWSDFRSGVDLDIYAQRVNFLGTPVWTVNGVPVVDNPQGISDLHVIANGTGRAIVSWKDFRDGDGEIYVQSLAPNGDRDWPLNGVALSNGALMLGSVFHTITTDDAGGVIAVWRDGRAVDPGVYAMRVRDIGTRAWPADVPMTLLPAAGNPAPRIVPDGQGGAVTSWVDYRNSEFDIYAQRVDSTGTVQWPPNGVVVVDTTGTQAFHAMTPEGPGGAIVLWRDSRGVDDDVYAQHLDSSGMRQWGTQGIPVCTATGGQGMIAATAPGTGSGAIAVWWDNRSGDGGDIYASEVGLVVVGVEERTPAFGGLDVMSNVPNPFAAATTLRFSLARPAEVTIEVFDVSGRRVSAQNLSGMSEGAHAVPFLGKDGVGRALPSGIYFYRVSALGEVQTRKMVIAK